MFVNSINFSLLFLALGIAGFLLISPNALNMLLMCEVVWVGIYFYGVNIGLGSDSLLVFIWVVLFLCLATGESVIGLSLLIFKFAVEGTIRQFYGVSSERQLVGKGYSRFWRTIK